MCLRGSVFAFTCSRIYIANSFSLYYSQFSLSSIGTCTIASKRKSKSIYPGFCSRILNANTLPFVLPPIFLNRAVLEHIQPKAKGGSNRISNLALSCESCNLKKGTLDIKDFLKKDPERLKKILAQAKKPLADVAAVNATRFKLLETLKAIGVPVETGSGGLTKFNRINQNLEKTHWIDAACVGYSTPKKLNIKGVVVLTIKATGHGSRQACGTDKYGFPTRHFSRKKVHFCFQTGDIVKAVVTAGKKVGKYVGRIATRSTGSFNISTKKEKVQGVSHKNCKLIHAKDGYGYTS